MDDFEESFQKITKWASDRGLKIEYGGHQENEFFDFSGCININNRCSRQKQLFSLLHECGHFLGLRNSNHYEENYPFLSNLEKLNKNVERQKIYKIETILEEAEAWEQGKRLASRLGIPLDEKLFYKHRADCLMTYVKWAAK